MADAGAIGFRCNSTYISTGAPTPILIGMPLLCAGLAAQSEATGLVVGTTVGDLSFDVATYAVEGTVEVLGVAATGYVVRAYGRDNGLLLGETVSGAGGAFSIPIYGNDNEVFVVAFDDTGVSPDYNALVKDRVVPL
jgi:hypothetical protein